MNKAKKIIDKFSDYSQFLGKLSVSQSFKKETISEYIDINGLTEKEINSIIKFVDQQTDMFFNLKRVLNSGIAVNYISFTLDNLGKIMKLENHSEESKITPQKGEKTDSTTSSRC